jgi:hypothetical protein
MKIMKTTEEEVKQFDTALELIDYLQLSIVKRKDGFYLYIYKSFFHKFPEYYIEGQIFENLKDLVEFLNNFSVTITVPLLSIDLDEQMLSSYLN